MSEQTVDEPHLPSEGWSDFGAELSALMPSLARCARSLARNPDTAQDLVQETVLKAWRSRASFEAGTNMKAWTFRILRNSFLSQVRRRGTVQVSETAELAVVAAGATCQAEPPVIDEVHERQIELLQSWRTKRAADRCLVG